MALDKLPKEPLQDAEWEMLKACYKGDLPALHAALADGANVQVLNSDLGSTYAGKAAIHYAVSTGFRDGLLVLRAHGADIDMPDGNAGHTPLQQAIIRMNKEMFGLLLEMGADLDLPDENGRSARDTALQYDKIHRKNDFAMLLEAYDALPYQQELEGLTVQQLFAQNADGKCLLDNPRMRRRFDDIALALRENGEVISLEDLQREAADGQQYLEKLMVSGQLGSVVAALNAQGEKLQVEALFNEAGEPTALCEQVMEWRQLDGIFTLQNLQGMSGGEMMGMLRRFPEEMQNQTKSLHQLRMQLDRQHVKEQGQTR